MQKIAYGAVYKNRKRDYSTSLTNKESEQNMNTVNEETLTLQHPQTTKKIIETKYRVMHIDAHLDEAFADKVACWHGSTRLPGFTKAKLRPVGENPSLTEDQCDKSGMILFGCGYGRYDDHTPTDRKIDSSSTSLVIDDLEVTESATLKIGREVHWCDVNPGVTSTQLANLVKSFHRHFPASTHLMIEWVGTAFDALREQLSMPFVGEGTEYSALMYFDGLIKSKWFPSKEENTPRIRKLLTVSAKNSTIHSQDRTYYTELDFIVRAMQRTGKSHAEVYDWVKTAFICLTKDEILFGQALEEIRKDKNKYTVPIKPENGERPYLRFCMLHTDNPMAKAAANFARQQIVVIRNSREQVQIFIDKKSGFNLDMVVGMMRWMETPSEIRRQIDFEDMCITNGSMACAPHLYYDRKVGQILNGTPTHPNVPSSGLASQTIIDIILRAFHPSHTSRWMYDHSLRNKETLVAK